MFKLSKFKKNQKCIDATYSEENFRNSLFYQLITKLIVNLFLKPFNIFRVCESKINYNIVIMHQRRNWQAISTLSCPTSNAGQL